MFPIRGARHQERGNVQAGDEKKQGDRAIKEPKRTAHATDDGLLQRLGLDDQLTVRLWELFAELALHID